ncbi:MAG: hypothetical protein ACFFFG_06075 [Candidatus Thorarchaeota archaeon]
MEEFNLKAHRDKMKEKHPNWTEKQCRNVLYWQGGVRSRLKKKCIQFCQNTPRIFTLLPEAMGVHVIRSVKKVDIPIKARPKDRVVKIALVGYPKVIKPSNLEYFLKDVKKNPNLEKSENNTRN